MATQNLTVRKFFSLNGTTINLHAFEGGMISAEVIKETTGTDLVVKKSLGAISYEDFVFETGLEGEITSLIERTWNGEMVRSTGSFITTGDALKVDYEDVFLDSLLTEVTIPRCDGASRDAARFRLRMKPALIRYQKGDAREVKLNAGPKQKALLQSHFKFELAPLPCSRVASIDSFTVKVNVDCEWQGSKTYVNMTTKSIDFPELFLTISSADLEPWLERHKESIVDGNKKAEELTGRLVFLGPNMRDELFAIRLHGVGIFSLQRNVDTVSRFRVGLYCERMEIEK